VLEHHADALAQLIRVVGEHRSTVEQDVVNQFISLLKASSLVYFLGNLSPFGGGRVVLSVVGQAC
jgi:hypothetical protein